MFAGKNRCQFSFQITLNTTNSLTSARFPMNIHKHTYPYTLALILVCINSQQTKEEQEQTTCLCGFLIHQIVEKKKKQ